MGCELGLRGGRRPKGFVVQRVEIFAHGTRRIVRVDLACRPILGVTRVLLLDIRAYQAGVDCKALTANQAFLHATRNRRLEHMAQQIAFAEATMTVLGKARVIRDAVRQIEAAEPPIGEVQMHLLAKPPL